MSSLCSTISTNPLNVTIAKSDIDPGYNFDKKVMVPVGDMPTNNLKVLECL